MDTECPLPPLSSYQQQFSWFYCPWWYFCLLLHRLNCVTSASLNFTPPCIQQLPTRTIPFTFMLSATFPSHWTAPHQPRVPIFSNGHHHFHFQPSLSWNLTFRSSNSEGGCWHHIPSCSHLIELHHQAERNRLKSSWTVYWYNALIRTCLEKKTSSGADSYLPFSLFSPFLLNLS